MKGSHQVIWSWDQRYDYKIFAGFVERQWIWVASFLEGDGACDESLFCIKGAENRIVCTYSQMPRQPSLSLFLPKQLIPQDDKAVQQEDGCQ